MGKRTVLIITVLALVIILAGTLHAATRACPQGSSYSAERHQCLNDATGGASSVSCPPGQIVDTSQGESNAFCKEKPAPRRISEPEARVEAVIFTPSPGTYHHANDERVNVAFEKEVFIEVSVEGGAKEALKRAKKELKKIQLKWALYKFKGDKKHLVARDDYPLYRFYFPTGKTAYSFKGDKNSKYLLQLVVLKRGSIKPIEEANWLFNFGKVPGAVPPSERTKPPKVSTVTATPSTTRPSTPRPSSRPSVDCMDCNYGPIQDDKGLVTNGRVLRCYLLTADSESAAAADILADSRGAITMEKLKSDPEGAFELCNEEIEICPDELHFKYRGSYYKEQGDCKMQTPQNCKNVVIDPGVLVACGEETPELDGWLEGTDESNYQKALLMLEEAERTDDLQRKEGLIDAAMVVLHMIRPDE